MSKNISVKNAALLKSYLEKQDKNSTMNTSTTATPQKKQSFLEQIGRKTKFAAVTAFGDSVIASQEKAQKQRVKRLNELGFKAVWLRNDEERYIKGNHVLTIKDDCFTVKDKSNAIVKKHTPLKDLYSYAFNSLY